MIINNFSRIRRGRLFGELTQNGVYQAPVAVSFSAADSVSDVDAAVAADESFIVFSSRRAPASEKIGDSFFCSRHKFYFLAAFSNWPGPGFRSVW